MTLGVESTWIKANFVGCHPSGYSVFQGWTEIAWFPTLARAQASYPYSQLISTTFHIPKVVEDLIKKSKDHAIEDQS